MVLILPAANLVATGQESPKPSAVPSGIEQVVAAVHLVHGGGNSLSPLVTSMLMAHAKTSTVPGEGHEHLERLSDRESAVVHHLARGMSNAEIARALFVSEGSIKAYLGRIMSKWHVRDRVQILVTAARAGLVDFRDQD